MYKALTFDDVTIVPQYSEIISRSLCDTSTIRLKELGCLGILHRFMPAHQQAAACYKHKILAAAVGTNDEKRIALLVNAGVEIIDIDVAHGHHILMKAALQKLKNTFHEDLHLMAGNVATREAFEDLANWGADSIRVGIGGGSICSTRIQTGHGVPTFQSILDCLGADISRDVKLIADGGLRTSGDIVKALAAGADFVMVGSLLAGTDQAPGQTYTNIHGEQVKTYRGMASTEAQTEWRGKVGSNEGISTFIPYKGSVYPILDEIRRGIRSGFSYSGCRTLLELQAAAQFVKQTHAGQRESRTHILEKSA